MDSIESAIKLFKYYKSLGEKTFAQLDDIELFYQVHGNSNSIGIIVKHLWGNMLSRWTDFLVSDGEKPWRLREAEFDADIQSRKELMEKWEEGWTCLFDALDSINESNIEQRIYIRKQGHSITEAVQRQLAHYAYHIGQIVFIGRMLQKENWKSLSIPKGESKRFNAEKFSKDDHDEHFTEEFLR